MIVFSSPAAADVDLQVISVNANAVDGMNANEIFANEANTYSAEIKNNGTDASGAFKVKFVVNGTQTLIDAGSIEGKTSATISMNDATIRGFHSSVIINVTADSEGVIVESDEGNNEGSLSKNVVYNGYKGKRYTDGSDLTTKATHEGNISLVYSSGDSSYMSGGWSETTWAWTADDLVIPDSSTVLDARYYQGYTYNKKGSDPSYTLNFNGNNLAADATYTDQKSFGSYDFPYGLYVYNVTDVFDPSGNSVVLTPEEDNNYGIYGGYLVVVFEDSSSSHKKIWINDEFDNLYAYTTYAVSSEEAIAYAPFTGIDTSGMSSASIVAILASANEDGKSKFFFNDVEYPGFWSGYNTASQTGFSSYIITGDIADGLNTAKFQSYDATKGDNMYAMNAILIVDYADVDLEVTSVSTNAGEIFANEANTYSAEIKNNGPDAAGPFNVKFLVNGTQSLAEVSSLGGNSTTTVSITDEVIRGFDSPVIINVTADSSAVVVESDEGNNENSLTKDVVYNGYKGKRYTDGSDLTTKATFEGNVSLVYSSGDSSYMGAKWSQTTWEWTAADLEIPDGATVLSARYYQGYTYNKKGSDPAYNLSFNGDELAPGAKYTDQKSFGLYNFPYGLYVFDATAAFDVSGNTVVLTPDENNNYSLYGGYLVVVYKDPSTTQKKIWINEEFDMLYAYSNYAVTSEEATAYAPFSGVDTGDIRSATIVAVLASAGDAGKSKFFFNDAEFPGFWPDYDSTPQLGFSSYTITDEIADGLNNAKLQSYDTTKGDNMYAMNAILVVEYAVIPDADFTASPRSGPAPLTVQFTDTSVGNETNMTWFWNFGDGTVSYEQNPQHTYAANGVYDVNLTVSNLFGTDTIEKASYINVRDNPSPGGGGSSDSGGDELASRGRLDYKNLDNTGVLQTSQEGKVLANTDVPSDDGFASVEVPKNTIALDKSDEPLEKIGIEAISPGSVPANDDSAVFEFVGSAYECTPAGATFTPDIEINFYLKSLEEFQALDGKTPVVRYYNSQTNEWEELPTTFDPETMTVTARISHFSVYAVFAKTAGATDQVQKPVATPSMTVSPTAAPSTGTESTAGETSQASAASGVILGIFIVGFVGVCGFGAYKFRKSRMETEVFKEK